MANHDPISDMLTRIRNASEKRHQTTRIPASRMSRSIARVLQQEGFIAQISEEGEGFRTELILELKYIRLELSPISFCLSLVDEMKDPSELKLKISH